MSTRAVISAPGSLDLRSYSEVLHWATQKTRPDMQSRSVSLKVYRWNTLIEKTGTFHLTLSGMENALNLLSLRFNDIPRGLKFVIVSWVLSRVFPLVTTSTINSQLQFTLTPNRKEKRKGVRLKVAIRGRQPLSLILKSISTSERRMSKSTQLTSVLGATGSKHGTRLNPEVRWVSNNSTSCNRTGCITTALANVEVYRRTFTSVNTPAFITKRRTGQLPVNPYSMNRVEINPGSYFTSEIYPNGDFFTMSQQVNTLLTQPDIAAGHLAVDENLLISTLRGRITATANISEDIATAHQTVGLLTKSFTRLATFLQLVSGGSPKSVLRFLGSAKGSTAFVKGLNQMKRGGLAGTRLLSQLWLEYRYGWLPLIQDVDSVMKAFQQYAGKGSDISRVSAKRTVSTESIRPVIYASNPDDSKRTRYYYENARTTCRMGIYYKMDQKMIATLSGLGLTSPTALAWELAPFSFVVDWFLPIGPALQAFSAFEGLTFVRGYKTYYTERTVFLNVDQSFSSADVKLKDTGKSYGKRITVTRSALTSFPGAVRPLLKNPFSFIHAANAAALIGVLLTRR